MRAFDLGVVDHMPQDLPQQLHGTLRILRSDAIRLRAAHVQPLGDLALPRATSVRLSTRSACSKGSVANASASSSRAAA
ncbi:MAG: hypothetical protein M3P18_13335 [Actinomycetota bacterium]|nr:hypothetical protein [Actinomycetota bacterium]